MSDLSSPGESPLLLGRGGERSTSTIFSFRQMKVKISLLQPSVDVGTAKSVVSLGNTVRSVERIPEGRPSPETTAKTPTVAAASTIATRRVPQFAAAGIGARKPTP
ncbi:hypothetical protein ZHAS_00008642 [Anopheles sinensis]|uniref:Uncharacterized protein n=1 Tax=Anopheles sinensis TaxID=74873 RepID=A0A084VST1_ANOSI|nr:hypothetical protein ZHAS_00008642 [Anopheles sinensis]